MKIRHDLMVALGAFVMGVSVSAVSGYASERCSSEECACEKALAQNTVEALEEFLRKYPHSVDHKKSACAALAMPPGGEVVVPKGQNHDGSGTPREVVSPTEG